MNIEMINAKIMTSQATHVEGITFSATKGDIVAITGGTSTHRSAVLLSMIGITQLAKGCVSIDCEPVVKQTCAHYRRMMSFLPTSLNFGEQTVTDVLNYELRLSANKNKCYSKEEINDELRQLSVPIEVLNKPFASLDKAIAQRIVLAITGLQRRDILLLNDPTLYQDESGTLSVMSYICSSQMKHVTIIVATNDPAILSVCNKVIKLNK